MFTGFADAGSADIAGFAESGSSQPPSTLHGLYQYNTKAFDKPKQRCYALNMQPRTKRGTFGTVLSSTHKKKLKSMVEDTVVEDIFAWLNRNYPQVDIRTKYRWIENALR